MVVADPSVSAPIAWITGANEPDHHVRNAVLGRDFAVDVWADLVTIVSGDVCPRCGNPLSVDRGIEVGHVFQLGTKYSEAFDARYTDESGEQHPMLMGCYGIGISRIVAAVAEEFHDDARARVAGRARALRRPPHRAARPRRTRRRRGRRRRIASTTSCRTPASPCSTTTAKCGPGVKFADADLVGMPVQIVVGAKGVANGIVERKQRATGDRDEIPLDRVVATLSENKGQHR